MRPIDIIFRELRREQKKLNMMPHKPFSGLLAQS